MVDWRRNLICLRTASVLLNFKFASVFNVILPGQLVVIVKPGHLPVLVLYFKAESGPIKLDLDIIIASVFD